MRVTEFHECLLECSPVFGRHLQICINLRSDGCASVSEQVVAASVLYDDRQDEDATRQKRGRRNDTPRSPGGPVPHGRPKSDAANKARKTGQSYRANVVDPEEQGWHAIDDRWPIVSRSILGTEHGHQCQETEW